MKINFLKLILPSILLVGTNSLDTFATPLSVFNGYTQITAEDTTTYQVTPGYGGQAFDAEYLYYKVEGGRLYLGLQTGFNISSGEYYNTSDKLYYYAGDLALSLDGNSSAYEYAIDFGLYTEDYHQNNSNPNGHTGDKVDADTSNKDGIDTAGLYRLTTWNNDIAYTQSSPFAMDAGTWLANITNSTGSGANIAGGGISYYRIVSIDLTTLSAYLPTNWQTEGFTLDLHWTMSCGNDEIEGSVTFPGTPIPEPATMLLFGTGLVGFAGIARRRMRS